MANDVSDTVRNALGQMVREALKNVGDVPTPTPSKKSGPLSGARGLAAGAGLAALAPLAVKGLSKANPGQLAGKAASQVGDKLSSSVKDMASSKVDEAGGAGGLAKQAASGIIPGLGGGGDDGGGGGDGMPGVGKGRRMPVQQSVDVAVPLEVAYNQWTQYEEWPKFMHRVTRVTQEDPTKVSFATKIWGKTKEFEAEVVTQRPDDRVKWRVTQGLTHTGVVSFHELAPRLTRIELDFDVAPGSLIEKMARGMRHVKRAARADLHRFKAFIEMQEHETGAWRGVIEDGEVVEDHDESYDEDREYSDVEDLQEFAGQQSDEDDDSDDSDDEQQRDDEDQPQSSGNGNGNGGGEERRGRFQRQAQATRSGGSSRSAGSGRSSSKSGGKQRRNGSGPSSSSRPRPGSGTRRKAAGRS